MEENPDLAGIDDKFANNVISRKKEAVEFRKPFEKMFYDIYRFGMPERGGFFDNTNKEQDSELFDDTLILSIPEFASELQAGILPINDYVIHMQADKSIPDIERFQIQSTLDEINDYIHEKLRNSNLFEEANESLQDIAIGTLNMDMNITGSTGKFEFTSIPIHEIFIDCGPDGKPDGRYRCLKLTIDKLKARFNLSDDDIPKKLKDRSKNDKKREYHIIECVYRDWSNPNIHKYVYSVVCETTQETIIKKELRGEGSNPIITARFSTNSGEVWGRGPALRVLPTVRLINLVQRLILENAQISLAGMWQYPANGVVNPDNIFLQPGIFIPIEEGQKIEPLQFGANFDVSQFVLENLKESIRKGMMVDTLDQPGKTPKSATQIGQEVGKFVRRLGASFNRVHNEFIRSIFVRALYLLEQKGEIEIPTYNGKKVNIKNVSPFAVAQQQTKINDFTRFVELLRFSFGDQISQSILDVEKTSAFLTENTGVDKEVVKSKEQMAQEVQNAQQLAMQNPELMGGGQ